MTSLRAAGHRHCATFRYTMTSATDTLHREQTRSITFGASASIDTAGSR